MNKILVVGGTGTVGSQIVSQLTERGASIRVLAPKWAIENVSSFCA